LHLGAYRGLRQPDLLAGGGEGAFAGNGDERLQLANHSINPVCESEKYILFLLMEVAH